jgi:hypothetical protein
LNNID